MRSPPPSISSNFDLPCHYDTIHPGRLEFHNGIWYYPFLVSGHPIDYPSLWNIILALPSHLSPHSIHGPDHWRRVERNGLLLATRTGAIVPVVRLFALFHDSRRENDCIDPEHGARGAALAASMHGIHFDLPEAHFDLLHEACTWHTDGHHHKDSTIGTCWDADRLDLGRVGMIPDPQYMSTGFAREIAAHGSIRPWLHLVDEGMTPENTSLPPIPPHPEAPTP